MLIFFAGLTAVVIVAMLSRDHDLSASEETIVTAEMNFSDAMIAMLPERIHLSRPDGEGFQRPDRVRAASEGLLAEGFAIAGAYVIDELPGIGVVLLTNSRNSMSATIYEHELAGVWVEAVSRYEVGTRCTHTTLKSSGSDSRPGNTLVSLPGITLAGLLSRARADRSPDRLMSTRKQDAKREFEVDYAAWIAARKRQVADGGTCDGSMDDEEQLARAA